MLRHISLGPNVLFALSLEPKKQNIALEQLALLLRMRELSG